MVGTENAGITGPINIVQQEGWRKRHLIDELSYRHKCGIF